MRRVHDSSGWFITRVARRAQPALFLVLSFACAGPLLAHVSSQGSEFQINTTTVYAQQQAAAAVDPNGGFVVVWSSYTGGQDFDILGRRFDASGAPLGPEFWVSTSNLDQQDRPSIAIDGSGEFVVVWESTQGTDTFIVGQRFDSAAAPVGSEFMVNTSTGMHTSPSVAMGSSGGFVVAWQDPADGSASGVSARSFDANGLPMGAEFRLNTFTTFTQTDVSIASNLSGEFLAIWTSDIGGFNEVRGRHLDGSGAPDGPEFTVNEQAAAFDFDAAVAGTADGGFVAVWLDAGGFLEGRRLDGAAAPLGGDFVVSINTIYYPAEPVVAPDATGGFVVAWSSSGRDGDGNGVFGRHFDGTGASHGPEFQINTTWSGDQDDPSIATGGMGQLVVAWTSEDPSTTEIDVMGQRFLLPVCGDGILGPGEECDDGPLNSDTDPDACRTGCLFPSCGDGVTDAGEECDDGNTGPMDGCTPTCLVGDCDQEKDCEDNDICDGDEMCDTGTLLCVPGTPLVCDDGNPCTVDFCDAVDGCSTTPEPDSEVEEGPDGFCNTADDNFEIAGFCSGLTGMGDGICDAFDNCVDTYNPSQSDYDLDGLGDQCDASACPAGFLMLVTVPDEVLGLNEDSGDTLSFETGTGDAPDVELANIGVVVITVRDPNGPDGGRVEVWTSAAPDFQAVATGLDGPWGIADDPTFGSNVVYVTESGTGSVLAVDLTAGATVLATGLNDPRGIDIDPLTGLLYVAEFGTGSLVSVDPNGTVTTLTTVLDGPVGVAVDSTGPTPYAYVTESTTGELSRVDLSNGMVTLVGSGLSSPEDIELDPSVTWAWVATTAGVEEVLLSSGNASPVVSLSGTSGLAIFSEPPIVMSLPHLIHDLDQTDPNGALSITLSDVSNRGVYSTDIVLEWDPDVLQDPVMALSADLDPNGTCSLFSNVGTGSAAISIFCTQALLGAGELMTAHFPFAGIPGTGSSVRFRTAFLNEGYPPLCTQNGSQTRSASISGLLSYYASLIPVDNAAANLIEDPLGAPLIQGSALTTCSGYSITDIVPQVDYSVIPAKVGDFGDPNNPAIDPMDAALNAQHVVGITTLNPLQRVAADVSANGFLTSFDSALIARFSVGLVTQFPVAILNGGTDWAFVPAIPPPVPPEVLPILPAPALGGPGQILFLPLVTSRTNMDFLGILYGDVSGNWTSATCVPPFTGDPPSETSLSMGPIGTSLQGSGVLELPTLTAESGGLVRVPLTATGLDDAIAFALELRYNPRILRLVKVETGSAAAGFSLVQNLGEDGRGRLGLYSPVSLGSDGEILVATFEVIGPPGSRCKLHVTGRANEGDIPLQTVDGLIKVEKVTGPRQ